MSLFEIFNVAGSGMSAQTVRMTTTASNLSNADTVANSEAEAYHGLHPVFQTQYKKANDQISASVQVTDIVENQTPSRKQYQPSHPMADKEGYVYLSNVNVIESMTDMISASRSFEMNARVMNMTKQMMQRTLDMGK